MPSWLQHNPFCGIEHHNRSGIRATAAQHSQAVPSTAAVVVLQYHQGRPPPLDPVVWGCCVDRSRCCPVCQWYGSIVYTKPALTAWALHTANQESGLVNTHRVNLY